jgi:heme-degrading monooxygenase HmoA
MYTRALSSTLAALAALVFALPSVAERPRGPIEHTVFFALRHEPGSDAEKAFFDRAGALSEIPGVEGLRRVDEISPKNPYQYGLVMRFSSPSAYARYNEHPEHQRFVEEVWIPNVTQFIEIDYVSPRPRGPVQ